MKHNLLFLVIIYLLIVATRFLHFPSEQIDQLPNRILGGIVPHHLFVKDIIGDFFKHLPTENIDNVIMIGPNHLEIGDEKIVFNPSFTDQSFSSLEPFITSTYPKANIIKVALKRDVSLEDCQTLAKQLSNISGRNLLIASIDFSHYLSAAQAEKNDQVILNMINNRDYKNILNLHSDYVDSPGSLVTALLYFDLQSANKILMLDNTNSGLRGNPYAATTSYFSLIFYAKN
jgi:hypothetical protein